MKGALKEVIFRKFVFAIVKCLDTLLPLIGGSSEVI